MRKHFLLLHYHHLNSLHSSGEVEGCQDGDDDDEAADDAMVAAQSEGRIFGLEEDNPETKTNDFVTIGFVGHPNAGTKIRSFPESMFKTFETN